MNACVAVPAFRRRVLRGTLCALLIVASACKDEPPPGPSVGTNSNWLRACSSQAECGELPACECGACTARCANDGECRAIDDARCALGADPAAWAACASRSPQLASGLCLPRCDPGSCAEGQACVSEACVLAPLPANAFCAEVTEWDAGLRTREEELLALLQQMRTSGGASCGGSAAAPAPALRFDPRLLCAARAWAREIEATGTPAMQDSQGRTTADRMRAAGYTPRLWGESYALEAATAGHALELMLADASSCARLTDPSYTELGAGAMGETMVLTIGAE